MTEQLERRLADLRAEYASGQQQMARLERQQQELKHMLLRISGAIQVLEELLAPGPVEPATRDDDTNHRARPARQGP